MPYLYSHACCSALARDAVFFGSLPPVPLSERLANKSGVAAHPPYDGLLHAGDGPVSIIEARLPLYRWGAQGPDIWFYHALINPLNSQRRWGNRIHAKNVDLTMEALLDCTLDAQGSEKDGRFAYFCGFLTHYALDCVAHPFVHSRCGNHQYHTMFEAEMDTALLALSGESPKTLPPSLNMPALSTKEAAIVVAMQSAVVERWGETVPEGVLPSIVQKVPAILKRQHDPRGRKRRLATALERLIAGRPAISRFLFPLVADEERDVLNLRHHVWPLPWSGEPRTDDFLSLLEAAALRAADYIRSLFYCVYRGSPKSSALEAIGQLSLDNGLPWRESFVDEPFHAGVYDVKPRR
jgi:hypothetical protein